jgi:hypothetical protein
VIKRGSHFFVSIGVLLFWSAPQERIWLIPSHVFLFVDISSNSSGEINHLFSDRPGDFGERLVHAVAGRTGAEADG